ncbi:MAG TPA: phosphoenolpyruvate carboxykinase (ATP), partial [Actinomycetota bacterium]|nr:phosphoenolpyruvate carboxykinase (ATP) [Actinomycetota bacterium]
ELLDSHPMEVFLMNTGRVGGKDWDERSKKVKIPHSSAIVKAIAEGTISWTDDADFGYEVATEVPGIDDPELLQPRHLYEAQGRMDEYNGFVERFKSERVAFLEGYPGLDAEIVKAVG